MNLPDTSRARKPAEGDDGSAILACCVASLTFALVAVFGTGAWPLIEAWVWRVLA
jgi:hypothetical protein